MNKKQDSTICHLHKMYFKDPHKLKVKGGEKIDQANLRKLALTSSLPINFKSRIIRMKSNIFVSIHDFYYIFKILQIQVSHKYE